MNVIDLSFKVENVFPLANKWAISSVLGYGKHALFDGHKCEYKDGSISSSNYKSIKFRDSFNRENSGWLDVNGKPTKNQVDCVIDTNQNYKKTTIDKNSVFDQMFEISKERIAIALSKDKNIVVISIPDVFSNDIFSDVRHIKFTPSADYKLALFWMFACSKIVIMENPLQ